MKTETAIDKLDQYFVLMDAATVGEQSVFANNQAKEWHESILTYAMRKYRAASYHLENVTRLIVERRADSPCTDILDDVAFPHDKIVEASVICRYDADTFIYELAAFLEAIKSSLDFLATASCVYLRGVTADSIRTLIRLAENPQDNRRGIGFEATKRHLAWLKQLRDYRHHLVHRMVICTSAGHEVHRKGAIVRAIQHPVVVPESTPSYYPDTRRTRTMEEHPRGLTFRSSMAAVTYADGTEEIVDFSAEYKAASGFIPIEEFMTRHFRNLDCFFVELLNDVISAGFQNRSGG